MTNRLPLALAVGAGYVLGRRRRARLALAVAGFAMGRRLPLSPQAIGGAVSAQLARNPQLKEVAEQVREDLGGVGRAATGALVDKQVGGLADRLEDRTRGLQEKLGSLPGPAGAGGRERAEEDEEDEGVEEPSVADEPQEPEAEEPEPEEEPARRPARSKKTAQPAKKAPAKKAAAGRAAPAKKTVTKKTAGTRKTAARKATGTARGGGRRG